MIIQLRDPSVYRVYDIAWGSVPKHVLDIDLPEKCSPDSFKTIQSNKNMIVLEYLSLDRNYSEVRSASDMSVLLTLDHEFEAASKQRLDPLQHSLHLFPGSSWSMINIRISLRQPKCRIYSKTHNVLAQEKEFPLSGNFFYGTNPRFKESRMWTLATIGDQRFFAVFPRLGFMGSGWNCAAEIWNAERGALVYRIDRELFGNFSIYDIQFRDLPDHLPNVSLGNHFRRPNT